MRICSILAAAAATFTVLPGPAHAQDVYQHLELIAEVFARVQQECPSRSEAASVNAAARINALPHRAGRPPVSVEGMDVYESLETLADAIAADQEHLSEMSYAILDGTVRGVDPRSRFAGGDPAGSGGVGATVSVEGGVVTLDAVPPNSAAALAGLASGDVILSVDGTATTGLTRPDMQSLFLGVDGSLAAIQYSRNGAAPETVLVQRGYDERENEEAVEWRREGAIGVITLRSFRDRTSNRVERAVSELKRGAPIRGYVVDIRGNGGGLLSEVVSSADIFLDGGEVGTIGSAQGCPGDPQTYNARSGDRADGVPVVLLVDRDTASGSELFAAALSDRGRARVVGQRTFGRGDTQTVIPIMNRRAWIVLTTGEMLSPSGRRIEGGGVELTEAVPASDQAHDYALERALQLLAAPVAMP